MSGWSTLKNTLLSSNESANINLLNKIQKHESHIAKKQCHVEFLTNCRKLQLIPNGLHIQYPYKDEQKIKKIIKKTEHKLLKEVIRILYTQIQNNLKYKNTLLSSFTSKFPSYTDELNFLLSQLHNTTREETKIKHEKKLEQLLLTEESTNPQSLRLKVVENTIINLANDVFTPNPHETLILSLGLNYAIPMQLTLDGAIDFMSATEIAIRKAELEGDAATEFRSGMVKIIEKHNVPQYKINRISWITRTIKQLKEKREIVILSADKGNATVVMKRTDYENKVLEHLNSSDYSKTDRDPVEITKKSLSKIVEDNSTFLYIRHKTVLNEQLDIEEQKQWIRDGLKTWIPFEPTTPIFYGLPKIHKDGFPLRPIVDFRGSISYKLAKHLNTVLKHYTKTWKYSTTNSTTFLENIKKVVIPMGYKMVSFDVKSLFTKVPVAFTLEYLEKRLKEDRSWKKHTYFRLEELVELTRICSSNTVFKFRDQLLKQDNGLPMGSPLSPILAEFCMQSLEEKIVDNHPFIKFWVRYVDDVYAIVNSRKSSAILNELNNYHPNIQFTIEEEDFHNVWGDQRSGLPFLDVLIYRQPDASIGHCVYRKPTNTNRYLHFTSNHPKAHKVSVVDSQVTRALFLCDQFTIHKELDFVTKILQDNGYPINFIKRRIQFQRSKQQTRKNKNKDPNDNSTAPTLTSQPDRRAVLPYYEGITEKMASFIRRNTDLDIAYVPQNKISGHLNTYKDKKRTSPAGIYKIPCDGKDNDSCPSIYIGESRQGLDKRAQQHLYHIRQSNIQISAPAEHVASTGHKMDPYKITMIENENNTFRRKVKEGLYIRSTTDTINKNNGFNPHPSWTHILKKKFSRHQEKIHRKLIRPP